MTRYSIHGKNPLRGSITVSGSRQAALWMIAASLLTNDKVTLTNVPHIHDVELMLESLRRLGAAAEWTAAHEVTIHAAELPTIALPSHMPISSVSSALFFGALLVRSGQVSLLAEHGPADLHPFFVYQLEQFGAYVEQVDGTYRAEAEQLRSTHIVFSEHTVVGTVQAIFLAVLAMGQTVIEHAASEPEVQDLLAFFQSMGATFQRPDEQTLIVDGVTSLHGVTYSVMPDRLTSVAFGVAALMSEGDVLIKGVRSGDILAFLAKLQQLGANYKVVDEGVRFWAARGQSYRPISLEARPHPGLPQNWLPLLLPLLSRVDGTSTVRNVTEQDIRILHQLQKLGMESHVMDVDATVFGPAILSGGLVEVDHASEAVAVVLAALGCVGTTEVSGIDLLDHVMEHADTHLTALGAKLLRSEAPTLPDNETIVGAGG